MGNPIITTSSSLITVKVNRYIKTCVMDFYFSPNTRLEERWNTWHQYANQLATNMRNLHEKMCSAVFTDMIAHLKIVNEMLNVEVSSWILVATFQSFLA